MKPTQMFGKVALILLLLSPAVHARAQAKMTPEVARAQEQFGEFRSDGRVRVNLKSGGHVTGNIVSIGDESVSISQGQAPDRTIALTDVKSVHDRSSLGSRFQMGPCIGPVTIAIASPFIVARYLLGR